MNKVLLRNVATLPFCILFLLITTASAQDIHFSQFNNASQNINPALAGVFHGTERYTVNYRNQWSNVPVNYLTFAAAYDTRVNPKFLNKKSFGLSGYFFYDRAGDSDLYNSILGISASHLFSLNSKNTISAGLGLSLNVKGYDDSNLSYNSQFDGELYNPNLNAGEDDLRLDGSIAKMDLSLGLNWHHKKTVSKRSSLDFGIGAFHLNKPKDRFYNNNEKLNIRFSGYAIGIQQINRTLDILGRALINRKGTESEVIAGIAARFFIEPHRAKPLALQLGISHRFFEDGDAWVPNFEFLYKSWTFGLSYDLNVSDFNITNNRRGGPELVLIYRTAKAKELDKKNCKIF